MRKISYTNIFKALLLITCTIFAMQSKAQSDSSSVKYNNLTNASTRIDSMLITQKISIAEKDSLLNKIDISIEHSNQRIKDLKKEIDSLEKNKKKSDSLSELRNKEIAEKDKKSKQKDSILAVKDKILVEKDSTIELKNNIIKSKDSIIAFKDTTIRQKEKTIDSTNKTIQSQMALIAKQEDSLEVIAKIEISSDSVDIRKFIPGPIKDTVFSKAKINHIHINVKEGIVLEIIVTTDYGTFRNKTFIADFVNFEKYNSYHLDLVQQIYRKNGDSLYVFLDDVIKYTPIRSFYDVPYADFDIDLLPPDNKTYLLRESTSLNTYFNVAAFTDIKGIGGDPNGIAQFTGEAKFIFNTSPIRRINKARNKSYKVEDSTIAIKDTGINKKNYSNLDTSGFKKENNFKNTTLKKSKFKASTIVPFNFVSFVGGLSKFDNDFKGTQSFNKDHDSVSRMELLQRANYSVGVKLNLLKGLTPPSPYILYSHAELNIGFNFLGTKIFDTSKKDSFIDTAFRNVTQNQWYLEPKVTFTRHRNFAMTLALPFFMNNVKESAGIKNRSTEYWICPSVSLMYYGKRDSGSKLFFRYNHYINLKDKEFAFSQMQLGYSVNLTEVWGNNK